MNLSIDRSCFFMKAMVAWMVFASGMANAQQVQFVAAQDQSIIVKRLPWRVALAVIDPTSGSMILAHENSPELSIVHADAFENAGPLKTSRVIASDPPHDIVFRKRGRSGGFVARTKQGELFWVDGLTLEVSQSIHLGPTSKNNSGHLSIGNRTNLVYTTQSAGPNDLSIPPSLVAIDIESDPPQVIEIRNSKSFATQGQFAVSDDETAVIVMSSDDRAEYFTLSSGTLGKPGEDYLRVSSSAREIRVEKPKDDWDVNRIPIFFGQQKAGLVIARTVWSADAKAVRGTLTFQPSVVFENEPWVAGIANLSLRVASLRTATTIGTTTLPSQMLRGLPHNDTIDEIGLPYTPINAIILADVERHRMFVIIGDHIAIVPLDNMGLPSVDRGAVFAARHFDEELDIEQFAVSPDGSKIVTLSGDPDRGLIQTMTLYDRNNSSVIANAMPARKIQSVALADDAVYVADVDEIVTQLKLDSLEPIQELGLRCDSLSIMDQRFIFADQTNRYDRNTSQVTQRIASILDAPQAITNQEVGNGWLIDGAYHDDSSESGSIGPVTFLFQTPEFVSTATPASEFDFWNHAYPESRLHSELERNTRHSETLLCPPVRCPSMPIQLSLVQSVVELPVEAGKTEVAPAMAAKTESVATSVFDVQLALEARNLVDGGLIKKFPLLRERFAPKGIETCIRVERDSVFVLHRGTLIDVSIDELKTTSFPRGPSIDASDGPLLVALQRIAPLRYTILDGKPPFEIVTHAMPMMSDANTFPLSKVQTITNDRQCEFQFDLETWLRENIADVGKKFDEHFFRSETYDSDGDTIENLRQYMLERQDRISTILGRDPAGIPLMIGINIRVSDADKISCQQHHYVVVELPAKALVNQIERARSERRVESE